MPKQVVIYSTPSCPYCRMAKEYFKERNIDFVDIDIVADPAKAQEVIDKSGQMGVPVILVDGQIVIGFNKPELEKLLQ